MSDAELWDVVAFMEARPDFSNLFAVALGGRLPGAQRPAISRTTFHSSSRTGATDNRDWRMSSIFASLGSALISASVTGRCSGFTGSTRARTQSGAFGRARRRA